MACVVCLEDGAAFVCECSAFHLHCFASFLGRGHEECTICYGRFDRKLKAEALELLCSRTSGVLGTDHHTAMVRKLEMAVALADVGRLEKAKRFLDELISTSEGPDWIPCVSQVELARILYHADECLASCCILEDLLQKLVRMKARWAWLEHLEACTVLGSCYANMGRFVDAERLLLFAMDGHLKDKHACLRKVVKCMQSIAKFYHLRSDFALACETHRVACGILEVNESDPSRVALAAIELAKSEVRAGDVLTGVVRFRTSVRTLRKRKHDEYASDGILDARRELAKLIRPSKRLRGKTAPEDC